LLKIERVNDKLILFDDLSEKEESQGLLEVIFEDGKLVKETTLSQIRETINTQI
jgi:nicotinamide phosphoribosyltransferase